MVVDDLSSVTDAFRHRAGEAGLFFDFDGTLANIVDDPDAARPVEGAPELLTELADRFGCVAVLSGRPLDFLARYLGPPVVLAGLYGLELQGPDGRRIDHPQGGAWREVVDDVAAHASAHGPEGMLVEPKGLSLTLHFREHPEIEAEVRALAEAAASRSGLELRTAKMSYELHPPIAADKGTALRSLADDLGLIMFVGDDVGDLPAFAALDELAAAGVETVRVVVDSAELAPELASQADLVLPDPTGVVSLLGALADRTRRRAS